MLRKKSDWIEGVKGADFKKQFDRVDPTRSLKSSVTGLDNEDEVHLVVTIDYVTLNWVFFHKNVRRNFLRRIDIPYSVFTTPAYKWLDYFVEALDTEYRLKTKKDDVDIWKVSTHDSS